MFSKSHTVKLVASIAVAGSIAVVGARTACAQPFITDTLGGNGHAQASVQLTTDTLAPGGSMSNYHRWFLIEHEATVDQPQGYRFVTDTLGGNGHPVASAIQSLGMGDFLAAGLHRTAYDPNAYVPGGASQQVAQAIQSVGNTPSPVPSSPVAQGSSGTDWGNAGIDAGAAAGLMLLLAAGLAVRSTRRRVLAA
jgi:hypothetical protein